MAREFPSMTALLGLLAIAGYQNRDKIAEMLRGGGGQAAPAGLPGQPVQQSGQQSGGSGGGLGSLLGGAGAAAGGGFLGNGLRELMDRFQQNGMGDAAHSWVSAGPNREITPDELERSIGPDVLDQLTEKTGLTREDLLSRLSRTLPETIDGLTPDGRLPTAGVTFGPGTVMARPSGP